MEPRVSLVTLGTLDLDRAIRFYRDGLGWPLAEIGAESGEVAFFRTNGAIMTVYLRHLLAGEAGQSPEGSGFGGIVLSHNVRERQQVDEILAEAERAGGRILRPGREMDWGGYCGHLARIIQVDRSDDEASSLVSMWCSTPYRARRRLACRSLPRDAFGLRG